MPMPMQAGITISLTGSSIQNDDIYSSEQSELQNQPYQLFSFVSEEGEPLLRMGYLAQSLFCLFLCMRKFGFAKY